MVSSLPTLSSASSTSRRGLVWGILIFGLCCLVGGGVYYYEYIYKKRSYGWVLVPDPKTITCSSDGAGCFVAQGYTCPPGTKCSTTPPPPPSKITIPCPAAMQEQYCRKGKWIPGPASDKSTCVDAATGKRPLSCGDSTTPGRWDTVDWVCSTMRCDAASKPQGPPPAYVPCHPTSCEEWRVGWLPCRNVSPFARSTATTTTTSSAAAQCIQERDPSVPAICPPGNTCIGLPPTSRTCNNCWQTGKWSDACSLGCDPDNTACDSDPSRLFGLSRFQTRSITCPSGECINAQNVRPPVSKPCSPSAKNSNTVVLAYNNSVYVGYPVSHRDWKSNPDPHFLLGVPFVPVSTLDDAVVLAAWRPSVSAPPSQVVFTDTQRIPSCPVGFNAQGELCLVNQVQVWSMDPAAGLLAPHGTADYAALAYTGQLWLAVPDNTNTDSSSAAWTIVPELHYPLPVYTPTFPSFRSAMNLAAGTLRRRALPQQVPMPPKERRRRILDDAYTSQAVADMPKKRPAPRLYETKEERRKEVAVIPAGFLG